MSAIRRWRNLEPARINRFFRKRCDKIVLMKDETDGTGICPRIPPDDDLVKAERDESIVQRLVLVAKDAAIEKGQTLPASLPRDELLQVAPQVETGMGEVIGLVEQKVLWCCVRIEEGVVVGGDSLGERIAPGGVVTARQMAFVIVVMVIVEA